jgi:hypothetical protein
MHRTLRRTAFAVAACAVLAPEAAFACRCVAPQPEAAYFSRSAAVVTGTVVSVSGDPDAEGGVTARVRVETTFKGAPGREIDIVSRTTCAFDFKRGETYLLHLRRLSATGGFTTGICDGNQTAAAAGRALGWLKRHRRAD